MAMRQTHNCDEKMDVVMRRSSYYLYKQIVAKPQ